MTKPPFKPERPTGSQIMIDKFMKDGTTSGRAIAKTIDLYNDQHWYDRDRYGEMIRELKAENRELRERVAALEAPRG